jgi:hypothetical protein
VCGHDSKEDVTRESFFKSFKAGLADGTVGRTTFTSRCLGCFFEKMNGLAFKMILTAVGPFAYTSKEDGVLVCPISALKP